MPKKARTRGRTPKRKPSRKRRARTRLKGGMVQTDQSKSSWEAVRAMILKGGRLELISSVSVSGFIFRLDIPENESSEFVGLNKERTAFTQPVYSIVLKFVFLSETRRNITIQVENDKGGKRDIVKSTERASNFRLEAAQQQMIYQETLLPQGHPVTLAVVDVSKFDALNTRILIDELNQVQTSSDIVPVMLDYLKTNVNENVHLGLITMELANPSFGTLKMVRSRLPINVYDDACAYALAQVALLFVKLKVVLFDCHEANVLVNTAVERNPDDDKSILIDFGRMFRLGDFFTVFKKKEQIIAEFEKMSRKSFRETMVYIRSIREGNVNENKLLDVLHNLAFLDCAIALPRMVKPNPAEAPVQIKRPQMLVLLRYLHPELEKREDDWLSNPFLLQKVEQARVQKVLSMFRQMVAASSSEEKELSLLQAKGQLYRVPDSIPNQVLTPLPTHSPHSTETPRVKTPPTVIVTTPQPEPTQAYSQENSPNKRMKLNEELQGEASEA